MNKKTISICSLSVILFFMILSCEQPVNEGVIQDNAYTVVYLPNGGTGEMKASVFTVGVWNNLPSNTYTREGYVFTGWAVTVNGNVEYADRAAVKDIAGYGQIIALYAKWGVYTYTVAYDANGGEGHMAPDIYSLGQPYALSANTFTREGYTFAGWAVSADGDAEYADKAAVQDLSGNAGETVMLYAVWKGITYTIEYKASGGSGNMADSIFTYDEPQELRTNAFIMDDYVFAGWAASEAGDIVYADEDSLLNLTAVQGDVITLYAKWGKNIFTVSYVANGGRGHMAPGIVTLGQDYTLAANTFTREGYFFIGWSLLNNGEVHLEDEGIIQNAGDITGKTIRLFAVWLPEMVITWPVELFALYGQTLSDLWIPDEAYTQVPGTFTWAAPDDPVGNAGVRLHRMIYTPEDTVHYDVLTQDMEVTVYPRFLDITGTPGRALIPFDSADTLYGKTTTLEITLDGLLDGDTVTLAVREGYGLSLSGNTGIGNNTSRTINVSYDGTTKINESGPVSLALYISGNDNYILDSDSGFEITVFDGQAESRAIPVTQAGIGTFNSYANTKDGLSRHYKLVQNIATYPGNWEPIGTNNTPFTGSFDGNGFTISDLVIKRPENEYQGIFGYIGTGGAAKNIGLVNCNIEGNIFTGGITGYNNGTIQNCYVSGSVIGDVFTGGIAGYNNNGTIQNCYSTSSVNGGSYIGGVAGQNNNMIQNCYATGRISGDNYIGGIEGRNNLGTIQNCTALNSIITASGGADAKIGRVAGSISGGVMSNNYARSDMSVKYSWNGSNGTTKAITASGSGIDGSGVGSAQYTTQSWWVTAGNNFTEIWAMNVNNLPRLRAAGGAQNHELTIGDGTEANPYRLYNEATLKRVGTGGWGLDKYYLQIQDITLTTPVNYRENWTAIGKNSESFTGVYDGGGYAILNLYNIDDRAEYQGLFRYIGRGGVVKNLGLPDSRTIGITYSSRTGSYTGGIAGQNYGTIQNCYVSGSVEGYNYVGGITGDNNGTIENCYVSGSVKGSSSYVGGIAGYNYGRVQTCYTTGSVNSTGSNVGGVVGSNSGTVQNCYATGSVNGTNYVGGVAGSNSGSGGTIQNCYAMGSVNGTNNVGGVTGENSSATVRNCSALNSIVTMSDITGVKIGRVAGSNSGGSMSNNYAKGSMTVRYSWDGTPKDINKGLTTTDGADIGPEQFKDPQKKWWQNAANWATGGIGAWNFTGTWEMNIYNLPKLKNVGGIQDHQILNEDGTENNPFSVYDDATLRKVGSGRDGWNLDSYYRQAQSISLQSNWTAIGKNEVDEDFRGSFDGNGFTISNITINRPNDDNQGIFGYIGTNGVVKNIGVVNCKVSGHDNVGGVAGYNNGTIQNCYVTGSVSGGNNTGGVAGYNNGTIQNCYSTSSVSGNSYVGGVVGRNNKTVQNCYTLGSVSGSSGYIGGVAGGVVGNDGIVRNCVALNPRVTTSGSNSNIGRVIGTGRGSNNHSRSDMVLKYYWNGSNGTSKTISADLNTADGANTTTAQCSNTSWWGTAANWNTTVWDFLSIWAINLNNLPKLKNVGGAQDHAPSVYSDFIDMVWIRTGNFQMGSLVGDFDRFDDEVPRHQVNLTGFYMGKHTVTQAKYEAVTGNNPSGFRTAPKDEEVSNLPVEQVTWFDAVEFCNKLSELEGLTPVYTISGRTPTTGYPIIGATVVPDFTKNGYRLPTEAQWEYACRAGTTTAYYTGNTINNNTGWYNANSNNTTHAVGQKSANNWGLYDMHGNVWEWCWDLFGPYSGTTTNPMGASSGQTRVNRGGSWYSTPQGVRSACRNADKPSERFANLGFRVVRP